MNTAAACCRLCRRLLVLCLTLCGARAQATNIVVNPGFELGTSGWTVSGAMFLAGGVWAHDGLSGLTTACVGHACVATPGQGAYLEQTLATTPGARYDLSFWVGESLGPISEMTVFWNGAMVADIVNPANHTVPGAMLQFHFDGLSASGASTLLEVHGRSDPWMMGFDDFIVAPAATLVPEPATPALLLAGLLCCVASLARRRPAQDAGRAATAPATAPRARRQAQHR